jgi:hypothetical protein
MCKRKSSLHHLPSTRRPISTRLVPRELTLPPRHRSYLVAGIRASPRGLLCCCAGCVPWSEWTHPRIGMLGLLSTVWRALGLPAAALAATTIGRDVPSAVQVCARTGVWHRGLHAHHIIPRFCVVRTDAAVLVAAISFIAITIITRSSRHSRRRRHSSSSSDSSGSACSAGECQVPWEDVRVTTAKHVSDALRPDMTCGDDVCVDTPSSPLCCRVSLVHSSVRLCSMRSYSLPRRAHAAFLSPEATFAGADRKTVRPWTSPMALAADPQIPVGVGPSKDMTSWSTLAEHAQSAKSPLGQQCLQALSLCERIAPQLSPGYSSLVLSLPIPDASVHSGASLSQNRVPCTHTERDRGQTATSSTIAQSGSRKRRILASTANSSALISNSDGIGSDGCRHPKKTCTSLARPPMGEPARVAAGQNSESRVPTDKEQAGSDTDEKGRLLGAPTRRNESCHW